MPRTPASRPRPIGHGETWVLRRRGREGAINAEYARHARQRPTRNNIEQIIKREKRRAMGNAANLVFLIDFDIEVPTQAAHDMVGALEQIPGINKVLRKPSSLVCFYANDLFTPEGIAEVPDEMAADAPDAAQPSRQIELKAALDTFQNTWAAWLPSIHGLA